MEDVPLTWRARKGYICYPIPEPELKPAPTPAPPAEEPAPPAEPAPAPPQIMVSHNHYVVVPQPQPIAYAAQIYQSTAPITLTPVPTPTVAAASKKAPSVAASKKSTKSTTSSKKADGPSADEDDGPKVSPPPQPEPAPPAAPASAPPDSERTLVDEPAKKDPNCPPSLYPGTNYMFPAEHTKLHIFNKSSKVWEDKHAGKSFNFKIFNVATTFTPKMVIENVLKGADGAERWAITEVVEKGDGGWAKGTTIEYAGERAGCSLASMGWTGKRGWPLPPVWVVVHKV